MLQRLKCWSWRPNTPLLGLQGRQWRALLLGAPMSLGALGVGFAAQGLLPSSSGLSGPLLQAMLQAPPQHQAPRANARDDLRGLAAERTAQRGLQEPARGVVPELDIRVAIAQQASRVELSASGPWWLRRRDGGVLQHGKAGERLSLGVGDALPPEVWLETTPDQAVEVDGRRYAGRLRLLNPGDGLLVVNHLPLEQYVASVVGAEMPSSWDLEALKAQAVAARSYALAHMARPASSHWHLGDSTRWQAYRGLESETSRTRQAAADTVGLILSYQGGIVESLYAANSQISWEAHGHLGASMSQEGAQALASRGLRFTEILGHYYRGASLARLRLS
jgi:Stage II sporulation protein